MTVRIVHLADLHLDMPFVRTGRGSQISNARREGLREALKRALNFARERQADALTIGGDLYEAEYVTQDTAQFLRHQFEAAAPLRIFIAPGNHDPYTRSSLYAHIQWPDNVFIFNEPQLKPIALKDNLKLWGAGHDTADFKQPLLRGFRLPDLRPGLLLLHGTDTALTLSQDKGVFCPFSEDNVRQAGFDLALLGHIHHQRLHPTANPLLCYPGSPEPLGFDEESGHSILLAEWNGREWHVEPHDISLWMCRSIQVNVSDMASRDALIEHLRRHWVEERQSRKCLLRADLVGQLSSSLELDLSAVRAALASDYAQVQLDDKTAPPFDFAALEQDQTITGSFVRRMEKMAEVARQAGDESQRQLIEKALIYGLLALDNREIRVP